MGRRKSNALEELIDILPILGDPMYKCIGLHKLKGLEEKYGESVIDEYLFKLNRTIHEMVKKNHDR